MPMGYGFWRFGKAERLYCISSTPLRDPDGDALCVAHKTTTYAFMVPYWVRDDGYVLKATKSISSYYPMPVGRELSELQDSGQLPKPLPPYSTPLFDYAMGNALWLSILSVAAWAYLKHLLKLRRVASLRNEPSAPGAPLTLQTKGDQWLHTEATRLLAANERVLEQAYGYNGEEERQITKALFVVVTDRRVLVIESRLGTTPRLESNGLTAHERVAIEAVTTDERRVTFLFPGGAVLEFFAEWSQRHFSNQRRFLRDVPRMLGNAEPQLESAHGAEPVAAATE